jgi:hypothetical protein
MRNGIVHAVGRLLASNSLFDRPEGEATRATLLKVLEDRVRDVNSFARSKALQTIGSLVEYAAHCRRRLFV